jgi:hypothetical protein
MRGVPVIVLPAADRVGASPPARVRSDVRDGPVPDRRVIPADAEVSRRRRPTHRAPPRPSGRRCRTAISRRPPRCFVRIERSPPGPRSLSLVRRPDCPPERASYVHGQVAVAGVDDLAPGGRQLLLQQPVIVVIQVRAGKRLNPTGVNDSVRWLTCG